VLRSAHVCCWSPILQPGWSCKRIAMANYLVNEKKKLQNSWKEYFGLAWIAVWISGIKVTSPKQLMVSAQEFRIMNPAAQFGNNEGDTILKRLWDCWCYTNEKITPSNTISTSGRSPKRLLSNTILSLTRKADLLWSTALPILPKIQKSFLSQKK